MLLWFMLLSLFHITFQHFNITQNPCQRKKDSLGLWWTDMETGTDRCEMLDNNNEKESCGVCGRQCFDCLHPKFKLAAICAHKIFSDRFILENGSDIGWTQRCYLIDNCEDNYWARAYKGGKPTCNGGVCTNSYTAYNCQCPKYKYGMNCEHTAKTNDEEFTKRFDILYNSRVRVTDKLVIIVAINHSGRDFSVEITGVWQIHKKKYFDKKLLTKAMISDPTSRKLIAFCEHSTKLKDICSKYLKGYSEIYSTELRFPLIRDDKKPGVWFYEENATKRTYPIGYEATLEIKTFNRVDGEIVKVYNVSHPIFVDYPVDITCYKNVEIQNCPKDGVIKLNPTEEFRFEGGMPDYTVPMPDDIDSKLTCSEKVDSKKWNLWRVLPNGKTEYSYYSGSGSSFLIKPFVLKQGKYKVEYSYTMLTAHDTRENFAVCTIEVGELPLFASIKGGSKKSVNVEGITILDGSDSIDPNLNKTMNKQGLVYTWSCTSLTQQYPDICIEIKYYLSKNQSQIRIPAFKLKVGEIYNITLTVSKEGKAPAYDYQVVNVGSGLLLNMSVNCEDGCFYYFNKLYGNIKEYIFLRVEVSFMKVERTSNFKFIWDYRELDSDFKSTDGIRVNGTNSDVLKINKNKLEEGKTYYFRVKAVNTNMEAELDLYTNEVRDFYNCSITPNEGVRGITLFNFKCFVISQQSFGNIVYELYDKSKSQDSIEYNIYSGRMIDTKWFLNEIENFRLTNGQLVVYIYNEFKVIKEQTFDIKLYPFNGTAKDVLEISNFSSYFSQGRRSSVLNTASVIPDIFQVELNKSQIVRYLVMAIREVQTDILTDSNSYRLMLKDVKLCLSSVKYILEAFLTKGRPNENVFYNGRSTEPNISSSQCEQTRLTLDADVVKTCADIILTLAKELHKAVENIAHEQTLTQTILLEMLSAMISAVEILLDIRSAVICSRPIYLVNQILLELVQSTSRELVDVLYQTSQTLIWQQKYGDVPTAADSNRGKITSWVMIQNPRDLDFILKESPTTNLKFSVRLLNSTERVANILGLQRTILRVNPFWWGSETVNTNLILLQMCNINLGRRMFCQDIHRSEYDMHSYYNISSKVNSLKPIEGFTSYLDSHDTTSHDLDLGVTVYRFDPPIRAKMFIEFKFLNDNERFKILFKDNLRPDYLMMMDESIVISSQSPVYSLQYERDDKDRFYYMGILPYGNLTKKGTVRFTVKVYFTHCKTWLELSWGSYGCWVGDETNDTILQCDCNHFSLFGGYVNVPPHVLNPAANFKLFLTVEENWLPLILFIALLVLLVLSCIWGVIRDRKDLNKGFIIVLEDNYPGDSYAYLMAVYTGSRLNSGTGANVGVRIIGTEVESRSHILKSSTRKVLKSDSDDWFLIYTPDHLGIINSLQIWHDNSGKSPDWFVEKIVIFDLFDECQYIFDINVWIALEIDEHPEVIVATSSMGELLSVRKLFVFNFVSALRDTHYWTSIFWKHPRNPVSRNERIVVLTCFISVVMSFSLMFFVLFEGEVKEDDPSYCITFTHLTILLLTFLVAFCAGHLARLFFRMSFSHKIIKTQGSVFLRDSLTNTTSKRKSSKLMSLAEDLYKPQNNYFMELSGNDLHQKFIRFGRSKPQKKWTAFQHVAVAFHSIVHGSTLEPVRLYTYKPVLTVIKPVFVLAWLFCVILIIVSAILVVLFGFRLPKTKSLEWITVFIVVILVDATVLSTIKILLVSLLLSFAFQRIVPVSNYKVNALDAVQKHFIGDLNYLYGLLDLRSQPMYCPLNEQSKLKFRLERVRRMQWRTLVRFLVVVVLLLVILMLTILTTEKHFHSNSHASYMLSNSHYPNHKNFLDVLNKTHCENFLVTTFINQLYKAMWYKETSFYADNREEYWCDDSITRLLGSARIRQIRVRYDMCPRVMEKFLDHYCSPPWSSSSEDTDVYDIGWRSGGSEDVKRKSSAWRYTSPEDSNSSVSHGVTFTSYDSGGYLEDLGHKKEQTIDCLAPLKKSQWLDQRSRAIFLEVTLYNVNTRLFTEVVLVAEQMPTGQFLTISKSDTVSIDFSFDVWIVIFIVLLLYYFVKIYISINRHGVFTYFSKTIDIFEVVLFSLGFTICVLCFIHVHASSYYVQDFQRKGTFGFFSFSSIQNFDFKAKVIFYVLFACVVVRVLTSWRFGRIYFTFYYTVLLSWPWIAWLTFCLILCLVVLWRLMGYLFNTYMFANYSTLILHHKCSYTDYNKTSYARDTTVFLVYLASFLAFLLYVAAFSYYYKVGKVYKLINHHEFNFYILIKSALDKKRKKLNSK